MAQDIEKLEAKIKALQVKKKQATKKAKEQEMKAEFERLKAVENEFKKFKESNEIRYAKQGQELNDILVKYGVKTFKEGFEILEQALLSRKAQNQNN